MGNETALGMSLALTAAVVLTIAFRLDISPISETQVARFIPVTFAVAPLTPAEVAEVTLPSGLPAFTPTDGDQCWVAFPLCSPQLPETLRLRGEDLPSGLLP